MRRFVVVLALGLSCSDPVREGWEKAVPDDGKRDSELHHVGYQCTACHTGGQFRGPGDFSFAGTIFKARDDTNPNLDDRGLEGVIVHIFDRDGAEKRLTTNRVGNFFVRRDEYDPPFPVTILLEYPPAGGPPPKRGDPNQMRSHIGREGGCAACHKLAPRDEQAYVPEVYWVRSLANFPSGELGQ